MKLSGKKAVFFAILIGIFIGIFVKIFIADIVLIDGESMEPNFHSGQLALINRLEFGLNKPFSDTLLIQWSSPKKDDVVIYLINDALVLKRVAACEGDLLEFFYDSGYNLRTGEKIFPLTDEQYQKMKDCKSVPPGTILAIGDNSDISIDSRTYGFVSTKNILGKVVCRKKNF